MLSNLGFGDNRKSEFNWGRTLDAYVFSMISEFILPGTIETPCVLIKHREVSINPSKVLAQSSLHCEENSAVVASFFFFASSSHFSKKIKISLSSFRRPSPKSTIGAKLLKMVTSFDVCSKRFIVESKKSPLPDFWVFR